LPFASVNFIARAFEKAKTEGDEMKKTRGTQIDSIVQAFWISVPFGREDRAESVN
jgi:hypothetical protein